MLRIVQAPDSALSEPTRPVNGSLPGLTKTLLEMRETLVAQKDPQGVGLAANQVGLPYQLFLARFTVKKNEPVKVFINPSIIAHSDSLQPKNEDDASLEGCLSIPQYYGLVKRWSWIEVTYQKYNWETGLVSDLLREKFTGFPAVVIQHEIDHLNGHIFVQRILEQKGRLYKIIGKDKKGKEMWEEVKI